MINREDFMMIKEMRDKGCYLQEIAETTGISKKTVSRALKRGGPPAKRHSGIRASKLDPYKDEIDRLLSEQVWNGEVIYAHIRELGYRGGASILRDYIRPKRGLRKAKGTVRFETAPGKPLQHNWGELVLEIGAYSRKVYVAVNTLGFSRRFHVYAAEKNDAEHTYESLVQSFEYFGGVPETVWVDNQKAAVIEHRRGGRVKFNPGFLSLAGHYGFQPKACRPGRPQTKGKDERMVGYVKQNFFQRYRHFEPFTHLNTLLQQWLRDVADVRVHGTVKEVVSERFVRERPYLRSLPPWRFDTSYREARRVALDGYVDVRGNRYSVPSHLCGELVFVHIGLEGDFKVYDADTRCVATHRLKPATDGWQTIPEHPLRLWQETLNVQTRDLGVYEEAGSWN